MTTRSATRNEPIPTPLPAEATPPVPAPTTVYIPSQADAQEKPTIPHTLESGAPPPFGDFGRYHILGKIAPGGMGVVYKVEDTVLGRSVALKVIRSGVFADADEVERFKREAKAIAQLKHPHIVKVLDFGDINGQPYFTMELADGGSLADHLPRFTADPKAAVALLLKVARGVQCIHDHSFLHRDLKPGNILLEANDEPLVSDFGLAKAVDTHVDLTRAGTAPGTPAYMAPEQARGDGKAVCAQTDVWALGVILFEVLTGRRPFSGAGADKVTTAILSTDPPRPRSLQPRLDRSIETIILKCLEKEPAKRYASAGAVADDLGCWLRGEPIRAKAPTWWQRISRRIRAHPRVSAVVLLTAVAGLAAWLLLHYGNPDRILHSEIMPKLRRGEPVTLIGPSGEPRWFSWLIPGTRVKARDGDFFSIHSGNISLLELLPECPLDRFRIRADIRHEVSPTGLVGLYFCGGKRATGRGEMISFCSLTFADWGDDAMTASRKPFGKLMLKLVHYDVGRAGTTAQRISSFNFSYTPLHAIAKGADWRRLTLEVIGEEIAVSWGEEKKPAGILRAEDRLDVAKRLAGDDADLDASFSTKGSFGLLVIRTHAAFKNVVIEPLPERNNNVD